MLTLLYWKKYHKQKDDLKSRLESDNLTRNEYEEELRRLEQKAMPGPNMVIKTLKKKPIIHSLNPNSPADQAEVKEWANFLQETEMMTYCQVQLAILGYRSLETFKANIDEQARSNQDVTIFDVELEDQEEDNENDLKQEYQDRKMVCQVITAKQIVGFYDTEIRTLGS